MSGDNFRLGFECTVHINTGTYAAPVWVELDTVQNTSLVVQNSVADVSMRRGKGWKSGMNSATDLPVTIEAIHEKGNAQLEEIFDAVITKRKFIDLLILDGPMEVAAGQEPSVGIRFWANVSDYEQGQELENAVIVSFTVGAAPFTAGQEPKEFTGTVAT